jgi:hypothetical protein
MPVGIYLSLEVLSYENLLVSAKAGAKALIPDDLFPTAQPSVILT